MDEWDQPEQGRQSRKPSADLHKSRVLLTYVTVILTLLGITLTFVSTNDMHFLSPGPLISAHSTIEDCGACHTQSKPGKFGWLQRIRHDDRTEDVQACIKCHKVKGDVTFAHAAQKSELEAAQQRLLKFSSQIPEPISAKLRNIMFPTMRGRVKNLLCANCHQEHQGTDFNLEAISDDQCQSCHVIQFDSFNGDHPTFDEFPFKRRTRLIYDHARHFSRHYPDIKQSNPRRNTPESCSTCHTNQKDRRHMMLTSFDETCAGCHLDQILGKERTVGPKGIAFLTLPGIDVITLREKNAAIGEWPESSDAEVTPFMKILFSQNHSGAELMKEIEKLDLLNLRQASDQEIAAVIKFIWEIKLLYNALASGATSDVMADIPHDVIVAAQREWLPNLPSEMASRDAPKRANWSSSASEKKLSGSVAPSELPEFRPFEKSEDSEHNLSALQRLAQADISSSSNAGDTPTPPSAIESTVDPESWLQYGGWYRQDFAILYRPVGHKDEFIRVWLDLTGPYAHGSASSPAAQVFTHLTAKGTQGECVKCHSVDAVEGNGHKVNWKPASQESKHGRFTSFIHEPHFGALKDKGCLTCHQLQRDAPYRDSFEQGNPQSFVSGFSQIDKDLCQTCHAQGAARNDCMLCHKYHVNGIETPMIETKLPLQ